MDDLIHAIQRMALLSLLALGLTSSASGATEPPSSTGDLPELHTATTQKFLAGVAQPGEAFPVLATTTLPSGERFAQVEVNGRALWIELDKQAALPRKGETLQLHKAAYLFAEPVTESEEPGAAQEVEPMGGQSAHPLVPKQLGVSAACENFITAGAQFGAWGAFLMSRINRSEHSQLFRDNLTDMPQVCPRFQRMSDEEKKNFWVWLIAAMANFESSCRERVTAHGTNGTAAGLLQLHLGHEANYGCLRGTNSLRANDNLTCGLVILDRDIARTGKIFPSGSNYWEVLRPHRPSGRRTYQVTQRYAPCH